MGLRQLAVAQQVGLLFVMLFGALSLATIAAFARSLREADAERRLRLERWRRELRAVWVTAVLFWVAWAAGALVATLLFAIVSFLALREFITLTHTRRGDHRALLAAFFVVLPVQYLLLGTRQFDLFTVFIPVYAFAALPILAALGNDATRFLERAAAIQWGIMVCVYGLSHAPALLLLDFPGDEGRGAFLVLYLVVVVGCAQLAQQAASRRLRRRPAVRAISRSFSWRAWGLGAVAGGLAGLLLYGATPFEPAQALAVGFVASGFAALGQLVVQAFERGVGVHSSGGRTAVTGAVGLLDRVAPLGFAAPVFFHSVRWYFGVRA
jgi:phosphatidate cytidylyltransferase